MGFHSDPSDRVRAELEGRDPDQQKYDPARSKQRSARSRPARQQSSAPAKRKQPQASERSSILGQKWYDLGEAEGFAFPYDSNYFSLALQDKIENDPEMKKFLAEERFDQVERWVTKMITLWWSPGTDEGGGYLTNEVTQRNAKDYFLDTDWSDLRDYARSCLRAAYLKKHGRRIPVDPERVSPQDREFRDRVREVAAQERTQRAVEKQLAEPEGEPLQIDPEGRERLRSFVEKRRSK